MSVRFADAGSVDNFIAQQKTRPLYKKTQRDVKLLQNVLETKKKLTKIKQIPAVELSDLCEFIISVKTKDGKDCESSSLRSLFYYRHRHI